MSALKQLFGGIFCGLRGSAGPPPFNAPVGVRLDGIEPDNDGYKSDGPFGDEARFSTLSVWFTPDAGLVAGQHAIWGTDDAQNEILLSFTSNQFRVKMGNNEDTRSARWVNPAAFLTLGVQHNLVIAVDMLGAANSDARGLFYLDGVKITAGRADVDDASGDNNVGWDVQMAVGDNADLGRVWKGCIREFLVHQSKRYDLTIPSELAKFWSVTGPVDPAPVLMDGAQVYLSGNTVADFYTNSGGSGAALTFPIPDSHVTPCT